MAIDIWGARTVVKVDRTLLAEAATSVLYLLRNPVTYPLWPGEVPEGSWPGRTPSRSPGLEGIMSCSNQGGQWLWKPNALRARGRLEVQG